MLRRTFPSKLLIRFGVGYHPKTDRIWAFPTLEKPHELSGKGYYVKLRKDVLELFGTKGHYAAFKMGATYRTDMSQTIEKAIYQQALDLFRQRALWVPLKLVGHRQWQVVQEDDAQKGFQCIVIIKGLSEPSRQCCELNHKIGLGPSASSETPRILQNVPCYDSQQFWSEAERDEICKELNITGDTAVIGIPKHIKTVELAVALWRIGLYKS
ncbi:hypothetical protein CLU79DRAFT_446354 [Phycomyces nitens]|nr:hypothetical protein CLU79DRAFT_446354 [Phycomyces nitens]